MKNMKSILSHIKSMPYFGKFQNDTNLDMIKNLLPKGLKDFLCFMYIKNKVLFFVFDNPNLSMEFEYKKNFIKDIIKKIEEIKNIDLQIDNLKAIAPSNLCQRRLKKTREKSIVHVYKEKSLANFKNTIKDKDLSQSLEKIRNSIKKNQEKI